MRLIVILLFTIYPCLANINENIDNLIPALIKIESGGDLNAIGDNGKAFGQLQIWEIVIKDVNRVYKTNYKHKDAFYYYNSIEICVLYLNFWGKNYKRKTGNDPSLEVLSKIWNGGPFGYKKKSTNKYWIKVKNLL
jgi:hypothetical protein